jgi:hypothetical protein
MLERGVLDPAHRALYVITEPNPETGLAKPDVATWYDKGVRRVFEANRAQIVRARVVAGGHTVDRESAHRARLSRFHPLGGAVLTINSVAAFD